MADSMASNDVYGGSYHAALKAGAQIPKLAPIVAVSAMARVAQHLGFGITSNALYEPPYPDTCACAAALGRDPRRSARCVEARQKR